MPSSAVLPCSSPKVFRSMRQCGAPIYTRDFRPPEWERRSLFMIARASMQNGNPNPGPDPFEIVLTLSRLTVAAHDMQCKYLLRLALTADGSMNPPVLNMSTSNLACGNTERLRRVVSLYRRKILTSE